MNGTLFHRKNNKGCAYRPLKIDFTMRHFLLHTTFPNPPFSSQNTILACRAPFDNGRARSRFQCKQWMERENFIKPLCNF